MNRQPLHPYIREMLRLEKEPSLGSFPSLTVTCYGSNRYMLRFNPHPRVRPQVQPDSGALASAAALGLGRWNGLPDLNTLASVGRWWALFGGWSESTRTSRSETR